MTAPTLPAGLLDAFLSVQAVNPRAASAEPATCSPAESFDALLEMLAVPEAASPRVATEATPDAGTLREGSTVPMAGNVATPGAAFEVRYADCAFALFDVADLRGMMPLNQPGDTQMPSAAFTATPHECTDAGAEIAAGPASNANGLCDDASCGPEGDTYCPENSPKIPDCSPVPESAAEQVVGSPGPNLPAAVQQEAPVPAESGVRRTTAADVQAPTRPSGLQTTSAPTASETEALPEGDDEADDEEGEQPPVAAVIPPSVLEVFTPVCTRAGASSSERAIDSKAAPPADRMPVIPETTSGCAQPQRSEDHLAFSATLTDASRETAPEPDARFQPAAPRMAEAVPVIVFSDAARTETHAITAPHRNAASAPVPTPEAMEPLAPPEHASAAPAVANDLRVAVDTGDRSPSRLEIRVSDRGGKIDVAVHSPDADTRNAVRSDLKELVGRLERAGYSTDVHQPMQAGSTRDASATDRSFTANETARERSAQTWEPATHDAQGTRDFDHRRREGQEPQPRRFPQARPQSHGRTFIDEFKR